jgi:polyprenyl P-hydroxybenzoate/phenylacrylic acid decarboxylase-like protein
VNKKRLLIGITGASGAPLAVELLRQLRELPEIETHVMLSHCGELTLQHEAQLTRDDLNALCTRLYDNDDYGAGPASGSFETLGMVIIPCSMKTLAGVVSGYCDTLLLRAADVTLKERRKLVLVPRECPLGTIHLRNLLTASELGAVVIPPVPAYYNHPKTIEDVDRQVEQKVLSQFSLGSVKEWTGMEP